MKTNTVARLFTDLSMIVLAGFFSANCVAQETNSQKKALAEELISLMRLDRSMAVIVEERLKMEESAEPALSQEQKAAKRRQVEKVYNLDALKPIWVETYTEIFNEEQLRGMIAFFKGPIGQRWIETQPEVQMKTMQKMQAFMHDADSKLHGQQ